MAGTLQQLVDEFHAGDFWQQVKRIRKDPCNVFENSEPTTDCMVNAQNPSKIEMIHCAKFTE